MWSEPSWTCYLGLETLRTQKIEDYNSKILYDDNPCGRCFDARCPCIHKASKPWKTAEHALYCYCSRAPVINNKEHMGSCSSQLYVHCADIGLLYSGSC